MSYYCYRSNVTRPFKARKGAARLSQQAQHDETVNNRE